VFNATTTIYDLFLHVPLPVIRALRNVSYKKILAIRRAQDELDVGADVGGAGDMPIAGRHDSGDATSMDDDGTGELKMALNTLANKLARERAIAEAGGDEHANAGCCGCCPRRPARPAGSLQLGAGAMAPNMPGGAAGGGGAAASGKDAARRYHHQNNSKWTILGRLLVPIVMYMA
jgi:hypothetical protein